MSAALLIEAHTKLVRSKHIKPRVDSHNPTRDCLRQHTGTRGAAARWQLPRRSRYARLAASRVHGAEISTMCASEGSMAAVLPFFCIFSMEGTGHTCDKIRRWSLHVSSMLQHERDSSIARKKSIVRDRCCRLSALQQDVISFFRIAPLDFKDLSNPTATDGYQTSSQLRIKISDFWEPTDHFQYREFKEPLKTILS